VPESALRCPGCGAPASADTVGCDYCGSALATVSCPSCFAPLFRGSRFCTSCGVEVTREVIDDAKPLPCPRCKADMELLRLGGTTLRSCAECGGLWLDPQALQRLCDTREERAGVVSVLAARVPTTEAAPDVVKYAPCPSCTKLMNRMNFAKSSGVILDVCKNDGVWLDRGELQRVLGFVDAGGMAVSREREKQKLAEEQRRLAAMQAASMGGARLSTEVTFTTHRHRFLKTDDAGDAIQHLLIDALGIVFR